MSTPTDLERRVSEALSALADQVQPEHLSPRAAPAAPAWRRTPLLVMAAAASVVLALVLTLVIDQGDDRVAPAPQPDRSDVVVPPDVGRAWDRVADSGPARLDLDGDGADEKVSFLGEPSREYDGRVRLQTTLSGDGAEAYGVVDLGTTVGVDTLEPIDADGDGDEEMVLYYTDPTDPMTTLPMVLDLRDGVLVEAVPTDRELFRRGSLEVEGGTEHYDMVRVVDYWIEGGAMFSGVSRGSFASVGMSLFRPEEHIVDVVRWRLREDGALVPEPADPSCVVVTADGRRRACSPGEVDPLPDVAPVADERIAVGSSFSAGPDYLRYRAVLEPSSTAGADAELVVTVRSGDQLRLPLRTGSEPRVFTTAPFIATDGGFDGATFLVASEDGDEPGAMWVVAELGGRLVQLDPVGPLQPGTGYLDDGRAQRTWLTPRGGLFTAVADTADEAGPWELRSWVMVGDAQVTAVPRGTVCFTDPSDPGTARAC
ncbi:hypothetical protein EXE58_14045 [Nocardioides seonyuensis]|uniref:Uncharacterized protein n=1 Tax=Nocardioides seonyuensis TaxID=2518371 RepID=A0A4P7IGT5_9ACTN|nr:hypothetical protein [Nocardioides seonyuensis]QBX56475.1 hypothetical protein EXE58_14045 [Nocardioides seonyuensis]